MKEKCNKATSLTAVIFTFACMCLLLAGCDSLRFAPTEAQKQNAWLHNRTAIVTAETARAEDTSPKLQALTQFGKVQSRAFSTYCGLPKEFPPAETAEDILAESNFQLTGTALQESSERPDPWQVADSDAGDGYRNLCPAGWCLWNASSWFLKASQRKIQGIKRNHCRQRTVQKAEPGPGRRLQAIPPKPIAPNPPTRRPNENMRLSI